MKEREPLDPPVECITGRGPQLFPTPPCPRPATVYAFHDPYCDQCFAELVRIHALINNQQK